MVVVVVVVISVAVVAAAVAEAMVMTKNPIGVYSPVVFTHKCAGAGGHEGFLGKRHQLARCIDEWLDFLIQSKSTHGPIYILTAQVRFLFFCNLLNVTPAATQKRLSKTYMDAMDATSIV